MRAHLSMLHEQAAKKAAQVALEHGDDAVGTAAGFVAAMAAGFVLALVLDRHFNQNGGGPA